MLCSTDSFNGETNYYHGELHDYDFYKLFVFLTKTLVLTITFFFRNNDMITWKRRDNSVVHLSMTTSNHKRSFYIHTWEDIHIFFKCGTNLHNSGDHISHVSGKQAGHEANLLTCIRTICKSITWIYLGDICILVALPYSEMAEHNHNASMYILKNNMQRERAVSVIS